MGTPPAAPGTGPDADWVLTVKAGERYLRFDVTGTLRAATAARLVREIAAATAHARHERLMIDLRRMRGKLTLEDLFDLGNDLADALAGVRQVAVVQDLGRQSDFGAVVADQRGLNIKVFRDDSSAQFWLAGLP